MTQQPTIKTTLAHTYHRDGTVSHWSAISQRWERTDAALIRDEVLATMSDAERARIKRMAQR